jgi:hypothetical protein
MSRFGEVTNCFSARYGWLSISWNTRRASPTVSANVKHGPLGELWPRADGWSGTSGRRVGRRSGTAACWGGALAQLPTGAALWCWAATLEFFPGRALCSGFCFGGGRRGQVAKLCKVEGGFRCKVFIGGWIGIRRAKQHACTQAVIAY